MEVSEQMRNLLTRLPARRGVAVAASTHEFAHYPDAGAFAELGRLTWPSRKGEPRADVR